MALVSRRCRKDPERTAALALSFFLGGVIKRPVRLPTAKMAPGEIWGCSSAALAALLKLSATEAALLASFRKSFSHACAEQQLRDAGMEFVALGDELYPAELGLIYDPPAGLFLAGACGPPAGRLDGGKADLAPEAARARASRRLQELMSCHRIAIIGARAASRYGLDAARQLAAQLSGRSVCIISGLALGVDAAAHRGALEGGGGTIAVLGCGADNVYPIANSGLYRRLLKSGVIISEYPPGTRPLPWRFPARNRIIAGLSEAAVVVEARDKSGALITSDFCLQQGKEVFAVPGSIFSDLSAGPNALIKMGATPMTGAADILESWGIETKGDGGNDVPPTDLTGDEELVYRALDSTFRHQDSLGVIAGMDSRKITAVLVSLEIKGLARHEPGRGYSR